MKARVRTRPDPGSNPERDVHDSVLDPHAIDRCSSDRRAAERCGPERGTVAGAKQRDQLPAVLRFAGRSRCGVLRVHDPGAADEPAALRRDQHRARLRPALQGHRAFRPHGIREPPGDGPRDRHVHGRSHGPAPQALCRCFAVGADCIECRGAADRRHRALDQRPSFRERRRGVGHGRSGLRKELRGCRHELLVAVVAPEDVDPAVHDRKVGGVGTHPGPHPRAPAVQLNLVPRRIPLEGRLRFRRGEQVREPPARHPQIRFARHLLALDQQNRIDPVERLDDRSLLRPCRHRQGRDREYRGSQRVVLHDVLLLPLFSALGVRRSALVASGFSRKTQPPRSALVASGFSRKIQPQRSAFATSGFSRKTQPPRPALVASGFSRKIQPQRSASATSGFSRKTQPQRSASVAPGFSRKTQPQRSAFVASGFSRKTQPQRSAFVASGFSRKTQPPRSALVASGFSRKTQPPRSALVASGFSRKSRPLVSPRAGRPSGQPRPRAGRAGDTRRRPPRPAPSIPPDRSARP